MSVCAPSVHDDLLSALRGTPALRPHADRGVAAGLRAWLDDGIFERLGPRPRRTVTVSASSVSGVAGEAGTVALARGVLVEQLLRLVVAGSTVEDPFDDAVCALSASGRHGDLVGLLMDLDAEEHARLASEVAAHAAVLATALPSVPSRWRPRLGVRQAVPLAGGTVELRGRVDLALGHRGAERACVCLVDVTTSPLGERHERSIAYLGLVETLRSGVAPLRVAALSTLDGAYVARDVTPELLAGAVELILCAIDVERVA